MATVHAVSILTVGNELLDGRVVDTNGNFLCVQTERIGAVTRRVMSCADSVSDIKSALEFCLSDSQTIIVSGGLGPTSDDLTREAIGEFCEVKLERNEALVRHIRAIFERRGRRFEVTNERQAFIPAGAVPIDNPLGTAPGFKIIHSPLLATQACTIFALPGVPSELQRMFTDSVEPHLKEMQLSALASRKMALKLFGLPESVVGARIESLNLPSTLSVSYRASFPEIHLVISTRDRSYDLNQVKEQAIQVLGKEYLIADSLDLSFEAAFQNLCIEKGVTVAAAESCSGGLASKLLSDTPGSSQFYLGGVVSYSNQAKIKILAVDPSVIEAEGAVSYEVARQMAAGCRAKFGSDLAFSITGIAGPDGATPDKPVGLFYVGFCANGILEARRYFFPSTRSYIRRYSAFVAIDTARRYLLGLSPIPEYDPAKAR